MKIFVSIEGELVYLMARAEGPQGQVGDFQRTLGPGGPPAFGLTAEQWREKGPGQHEVDELTGLAR